MDKLTWRKVLHYICMHSDIEWHSVIPLHDTCQSISYDTDSYTIYITVLYISYGMTLNYVITF